MDYNVERMEQNEPNRTSNESGCYFVCTQLCDGETTVSLACCVWSLFRNAENNESALLRKNASYNQGVLFENKQVVCMVRFQ